MKHGLIDTLNQPWAIVPERLKEIRGIYLTHLRGEKIDLRAVEERIGRPLGGPDEDYEIVGNVALVKVHGLMAKRMNLFQQVSGGVSTQMLANTITELALNDNVASIVLDIDSPGGTVDGTMAAARAVKEASAIKPVVAFSDGMIASGAYWLGSAADQVYIDNDTVQVGSIGVYMTHTDTSDAEKAEGVKVTHITSGRYKAIGMRPLTDETLEDLQAQCDHLYSLFVNEVAENRGMNSADVLEKSAEGRIFTGQQALAVGLVDGVSTLSAIVESLQDGSLPGDGADPEELRNVIAAVVTAGSNSEVSMNIQSMTLDEFREARPDLAEALVASVEPEVKHAPDPEAIKLAVETERERIRAVEAQSMPGCEGLIAELKYDGQTTGDQAAVRVLAKLREMNDDRSARIVSDAPAPAPVVDPPVDNAPDFEALVAEKIEGGASRSEAIKLVVAENPNAHQSYLRAVNRGQSAA